jgi:hypothetical protein
VRCGSRKFQDELGRGVHLRLANTCAAPPFALRILSRYTPAKPEDKILMHRELPATLRRASFWMRSAAVLVALHCAAPASAVETANPYKKWKNSLPSDGSFFPIAVWLQDPRNAERYKAAGINLYIALWQGPTEAQLAELKKAGMPVVCAQNEVALKHLDDKTIVGWMHGDEPDNAQELPDKKGYGPPIAPEKIVKDYEKLKAADPTRPVMLNLGQGVAWDGWYGRGEGHSNHPEEYAEYVKGGDIVSFDIYPVAHDHKDVAGKLWLVPFGVERLCKWSNNSRQVWNCIECTHIGTPDKKATPAQVKTEVWMSLIAGSKGIIYFVHEFKPKFNEHALLDDAEMLAGVTAVNKQIQELAPVLNNPTLKDQATVTTAPAEVPVALMVKKFNGATYLFAVSMRDAETKAAFQLAANGNASADVLGEDRKIDVTAGKFEDEFKPYSVHIYKLSGAK